MSASSHDAAAERVRQVEVWISTLLRVGVALSLLLLCVGTLLTFVHHPTFFTSAAPLHDLTHPSSGSLHTLGDVMASVLRFRGQGVVMAGLLVLLATPIIRVAVSTLAFWHERDRTFALITLTVLLLLLLSLVLSRAGE